MNQIRIIVCLLLFNIITFPQVNLELLRAIDTKVKAKYGNDVRVLSIANMDIAAIHNLNYPIPHKVVDYYNILSGIITFHALKYDSSGARKGLVGLYQDEGIIWDSDTSINAIDVNSIYIHSVFDINNDGRIDIIFYTEQWGVKVGAEYLYIYSWDGNTGELISALDNEGVSEIASLTGIGYIEFIDVNGDGVYEIRGLWNMAEEDMDDNIVTYYWDGVKYSFDPSKPQPQSTAFFPRDRINIDFNISIENLDSLISYNYSISNLGTSVQDINSVYLTKLIDTIYVESLPMGWEHYEFSDLLGFEDFHSPILYEYNYFIRTVETAEYRISAAGLPAILELYIQGYNDDPNLDSIITLDDYYENIFVNSLKVTTVGPKNIDSIFIPLNFIDTLLNYNQRSLELGWITNQTTADKYDSLFNVAKIQLQQNNNNAARTTLQTVLQEVDIDSTNNLTSEAYALLRYNTEYLVEQLPADVETISTYSIFATHSVWIRQDSEILSGSVGVNEAGEGPFLDSKLELSVSKRSTTPAGYTVKGNRIKVKKNAVVNSDVYYNELTNKGTITGSLNTHLEFPLIENLPEFHSSTPGTEDIVVPKNGEYILLPGSYNDIKIKKNGKLIFTGGEYNINNIDGNNNNQFLFQSPSDVKIKDKFYTGKRSYIGPEDTTTLSADEIVFYIEGINGKNGRLNAKTKASKVGEDSRVKANFYVPNGTMWIRKDCEAEGSFIGKDVKVGANTIVKLNSAW